VKAFSDAKTRIKEGGGREGEERGPQGARINSYKDI